MARWARQDFEGPGIRFQNYTLEFIFRFIKKGHPFGTEKVGKVGICGSKFEVYEFYSRVYMHVSKFWVPYMKFLNSDVVASFGIVNVRAFR